MTIHLTPLELRVDALEERVDKIEERLEVHSDRFTKGDTQFIRLEAKIDDVAKTLSVIVAICRWALGIIGLGVLTVIGQAIMWAVQHMGKP